MDSQYDEAIRLDEDTRLEVHTWIRALMRNLTEIQEAVGRAVEDIQCGRPPQARDLVRISDFCRLVRSLPAEFVPPVHLEQVKIIETLLPIAIERYWDDRYRTPSAGNSSAGAGS